MAEATQESPFEVVGIQADIYELACKSTTGKEQLRMFYKGHSGASQTGKGAVPVPTPFTNPPENLSPALLWARPKRSHAAPLPVPRAHSRADVEVGERSINWGLLKQMESSVEDILSSISRLSGGKRAPAQGQNELASNQSQPDSV
eukprot:evm.model.scf_92.6 EVM.evm.TU.scf_92.6   scf_92:81289-82183(+)